MPQAFRKGLAEREREYAIKDAMIMATTLALAAQSKGYFDMLY